MKTGVFKRWAQSQVPHERDGIWGQAERAWEEMPSPFEITKEQQEEFEKRELRRLQEDMQKRIEGEKHERAAKRAHDIETMARQIYANLFAQPGIGVFTDDEIRERARKHAENYFGSAA